MRNHKDAILNNWSKVTVKHEYKISSKKTTNLFIDYII